MELSKIERNMELSLDIKEDIKTDHTGRANGSRFHISESTMELTRSGEEKLNEVYLLL